MIRNLTPHQVTLLLGTALVIGGLMVLIVYALHKGLRRQRREISRMPATPRPQDPSAFLLASLQGVVAKMKAREKELETLLRDAEQKVESSTRALEVIARQMGQGLIIFDREGFLSLANPAARTLLEVDTWSRRRYSEIFSPDSPLALAIRECLESGKGGRRQLTHTTAAGRRVSFETSLASYHGRGGQLAGAICIFAPLPREMAAQ